MPHKQWPKTSGVATIKVDFKAIIIIKDGDISSLFKDQPGKYTKSKF